MTQTSEHGTAIDQQVGARGRFTLRQASGDIHIRGVEGDRIRVRAQGDDRTLDSMFDVTIGTDSVELRQIEKLGFGIGILSFNRGTSPDMSVEVPHGATVLIETASGEVHASDLSGSKRFRTASGDLTFERLSGPLDVESVSGDIDIDGEAPIELGGKSISGEFKVRVPRLRRLELVTTSGDVWVDAQLDGNGPFSMRTISGDVTVVGRSGFRIEAKSVTGDLSSDMASKRESQPGRKIMIIGRPGPTLSFNSVSGDFRVVEPRDAAPESVTSTEAAAAPPTSKPDAAEARPTPDLDAARLEILRSLERGEITVAEATDRLGKIDEAVR